MSIYCERTDRTRPWRVRVQRAGREHNRFYATRQEALAGHAELLRQLPPPIFAAHGAIRLPVEPFAAWLRALPYPTAEIARELAVDKERVRRIKSERVPSVTDRLVERWGIALADNPRLVDQLYPASRRPDRAP